MLEYKVFKMWDKAILDKHKKVMNPPIGYQFYSHMLIHAFGSGRHPI